MRDVMNTVLDFSMIFLFSSAFSILGGCYCYLLNFIVSLIITVIVIYTTWIGVHKRFFQHEERINRGRQNAGWWRKNIWIELGSCIDDLYNVVEWVVKLEIITQTSSDTAACCHENQRFILLYHYFCLSTYACPKRRLKGTPSSYSCYDVNSPSSYQCVFETTDILYTCIIYIFKCSLGARWPVLCHLKPSPEQRKHASFNNK